MNTTNQDQSNEYSEDMYRFFYPLMFESSFEPTIQTATVCVTMHRNRKKRDNITLWSTLHQQFHEFFQLELLSFESLHRFLEHLAENAQSSLQSLELSFIWFISQANHQAFHAVRMSYCLNISANAPILLTIKLTDEHPHSPLNTGESQLLTASITTADLNKDWKEWLYEKRQYIQTHGKLEDGLLPLQHMINNEANSSEPEVMITSQSDV